MTDKPNYSLKDLLNELKEKEEELTKINKKSMLFQDSYDRKILLQTEISALKKEISACEEIQEQPTIEHYKKYGVAEGDKLLLETAKNNFKKGQESMKKEILEIIEKITSWTCKCGCITFDNKKCKMCGSDPAYGEIDYDELITELKELNNWLEKE
jgi:hypothetical protein